MNSEQQEYLEREYASFEKGHFRGERFWRAPVYTLTGTVLYSLFEEFSALFPDHPNEHEDVFYLIEAAAGGYSILFRCAHFEHSSSDDLAALGKFIDSGARVLTSCGTGEVERLDGIAEEVHIRFYSPHEQIVKLLQRRASRAT